jgi:AcrR family transcriptional regulator
MSRISQEEKEETKQAILTVATELFQQFGYTKTSTKEIAKRCKIAEGTIFNYFPTKDDILLEVFETMSKSKDERPYDEHELTDDIIEILFRPLRQLNLLPKVLMVDILTAALKLSKKKNSLLSKLLTLDMSYVAKVELKMSHSLKFKEGSMDARLLSEIMYSILATDYLIYLLGSTESFEWFEKSCRSKLKILMEPYL